MQMHQPQRTTPRLLHSTLDRSPRSTPIPGSHAQYHHLQHHFHQHHSDNEINSKDAFRHSPDFTSMTTDDEVSSSASFRQRPRKLSKAGSIPSPLGGQSPFSTLKNSSSNALSAFSFLSLSEKNNTPITTDADGKSSSQLRVRHLEQDSSYAGYLTKFSSRTFFSRKQWKRRYFILQEKSLYCFKSSDPQHPLLETLMLSPDAIICVTDIFSGKRYCLQISCPGEKSWYVLADTAPEMSGWLKELKNTVQRTRNSQLDIRPGTQCSDSSEFSDISGTSSSKRVPSVPALPSQHEFMTRDSRSLSGTPSSSLSSRQIHIHQSSFPPQQHQPYLDPYQGQVTSLNPPPRPITSKPSTPTPGPRPLYSLGAPQTHQTHQYGASPLPQPQQQETRRRRNSSLSNGQTAPDYASFGTAMERAGVMAEAHSETQSPSWSTSTETERQDTNYATIPRSKRESVISTMSSASTMSATPRNPRASMLVDRPESAMSLPARSSPRSPGTSSRPLSTVSSRPISPGLTRTSPRNSLVISPPPRSIHRPASMSIRHSTYTLPPPQIATVGMPSQHSSPTIINSDPPTSTLPATPESARNQAHHRPLSRITSLRNQRETGSGVGENSIKRNSVIGNVSVSNINIKNSTDSSNGSHSRQMSLPINAMYILPAPPTGQAPTQPPASAMPSSSRPLMQTPSGSNSALRPISFSMHNVASLGGGVARRPSTHKRDSITSARLSTLILPPEPKKAVPLPPNGFLPSPPTSALPKKPKETGAESKPKATRGQGNAQTGFGAILEEEEEEDDEYDGDGGYVSRLQFEELEVARATAEQGHDTDSAATTPTTATRPGYYATKESKVVEYIFPSESFAV